jgi:hypothetical protein
MSRLRAGRKRQEGERHPCGKLKAPAPNPVVLAQRRFLAGERGDLRAAVHPLDLAHARGWLSERHYRAGEAYVRAYRRARLGAPDREATGRLERDEVSGDVDRRRLNEIGHGELAALFDAVMARTPRAESVAEAVDGLRLWKALNARLSAAQQAEVFGVCVRKAWPDWIVLRAAGGTVDGLQEGRLRGGLEAVAQALWPGRAASEPAEPLRRRSAGGRVETTTYVTPAGAVLFEVERKIRR